MGYWVFEDDVLVYKEQTWWETLLEWINSIKEWVGPLVDLYKELEEAGIITHDQAEQAEAEGWTKEELISLIKAQMAPAWQQYIPWIVGGGIAVAAIIGVALVLRK